MKKLTISKVISKVLVALAMVPLIVGAQVQENSVSVDTLVVVEQQAPQGFFRRMLALFTRAIGRPKKEIPKGIEKKVEESNSYDSTYRNQYQNRAPVKPPELPPLIKERTVPAKPATRATPATPAIPGRSIKTTIPAVPAAPAVPAVPAAPAKPITEPTPRIEPPAAPVSVTRTVTYENGVFTPSTLNIKVGDTVMFLNKHSFSIRISSNPHPIHTSFPALESDTLEVGGTYKLTFTQAGTVNYHNHFNPGANGQIIVE